MLKLLIRSIYELLYLLYLGLKGVLPYPKYLALSSPRGKRGGPKGLRAESARAVTGRRCPHSGEGEDFLTGQLNFFYDSLPVTALALSARGMNKIEQKIGKPCSF